MNTASVNLENAQKIHGYMNDKELFWLAEAASRSKRIVEFGSYHGRSTRALADNTQGIVYAVDPWNPDYKTEEGYNVADMNAYLAFTYFKRNLADHIKSGRVIISRGYSFDFQEKDIDFLFIDGDHRYDTVVEDIEIAKKVVVKGGIISGHDYGHPLWPGVKQAVDLYFPEAHKEESIWWTTKF